MPHASLARSLADYQHFREQIVARVRNASGAGGTR
jgi:hypothetical protein